MSQWSGQKEAASTYKLALSGIQTIQNHSAPSIKLLNYKEMSKEDQERIGRVFWGPMKKKTL